MSNAFKVIFKEDEAPLSISLTGLYLLNAKPFAIVGGVRIWRTTNGEWYKPNGFGRYTMINRDLHVQLDALVRRRGIKTVYGTPFYPWKKIKIDFIQEIVR
jgi:hypothetical protein